jgi:UDP-2,3-diacylglucosamine hydrolase
MLASVFRGDCLMEKTSISHAIFVGDVHLDDRHPMREKAFCQFLDMIREIRPDHVFLMGDIFEFWFGYKYCMFSRILRPVAKIAQLTDSGIPVTYLVGNHDFKPGPVFSDLLQVDVKMTPLRLDLGSHRLYLSHGDEINTSDKKYMFTRAVFRHPMAQFLFQHLIPISWAWFIGRGVSDSSRKYSNNRERPVPSDVFEAFCGREMDNGIDVAIHGHNHDPGERVYESGGQRITIIDSGDWLTDRGYYVEFKDNTFQCKIWPFSRQE